MAKPIESVLPNKSLNFAHYVRRTRSKLRAD
jgi:hypothetical protein